MVDGNNVWNAGQPAERQNDASKPTPDGDMAARDAIVSPVAVDERGHLDKKDNCNNNVGEKPQTLNLEIGVVLVRLVSTHFGNNRRCSLIDGLCCKY